MAFDAGAIEARLTINPSEFNSELAAAEAKLDALTKDHKVRISAVFDNASLSRARKMFADLDNMISRDAAQRLRSSPQGSVLGALNSLFSPHPVSGAPTPQMSAQSGLLGQMITQQGGGGPAVGAAAASPVRQAPGNAAPAASTDNIIKQVLTGGGGTAAGGASLQQQPAILSAVPQLQQLQQLLGQISDGMSGPGQAGTEAVAAFQAQLTQAATALDALNQAIAAPQQLDVDNTEALASVAQVAAADEALKAMTAGGTPLAGSGTENVSVNVTGLAAAQQQASGLQKSLAGVGLAAGASGAGMARLGGAAKSAGSDAEAGAKSFFDLTRQVQLWGGAFGSTELIGQVQLWHILLDGLIETSVIVVETTLTMAQTIITTLPIWKQLYTNIKSTDEVAHAFGLSLGPVHIGLSQLQKDLQPGILELYGGAMGLIGHQSSVAAGGIQMVVTGFDDWIAKLDLFTKAQGSSGAMLVSGYNIMKQLAAIVDTLGVAFENLLKSDPGTVHYLLDVVEAGAKLIQLFSEIPAPILKTVIAIHGFLLWGGLLSDLVIKMASPMVKLGSDLVMLAGNAGILGKSFENVSGGFLAFGQNAGFFGSKIQAARIPVTDLRESVDDVGTSTERTSGLLGALTGSIGVTAVAIGGGVLALGALAYWMTTADTATHALISTLDTGVDADNASTAILAINTSISTLDTAITKVSPHIQTLNDQTSHLQDVAGKNLEAFGAAVGDLFTGDASWNQAGDIFAKLGNTIDVSAKSMVSWFGLIHSSMDKASDISAFKGAIINLTGEQDNLFKETGGLIRQGYSYSQSLALMDLAGVSAGDSFALMAQKVDNLIKGYEEMSVQGPILASAVDAVTFASEQQKSAVADITAGWTAFLGVVTGGASAFITFEQGMNTMNADAAASGASMGGVGTAALVLKKSLGTVSDASLTLQSQFQSQITNAEAVQAALLNQASAAGLGAKGTAMLTQAGKDLVAQLIPTASGSKEATAELYSFAQLAGYTGPDNLKSLTKWLGNTKDAAKGLDKIVSTLTIDSANLATDMNALASALQQNLNTAMAAAIFQADGGQAAFDNFATAVRGAHGNVSDLIPTAQKLATGLIETLGNTTQAEDEFVVFAEKMGLSQKQADALWGSLNLGGKALSAAQSAVASYSAAVTGDFKSQAAAAAKAQTGIANLTTATSENGYESQKAQAARQQLIADLIGCGVKSGTATTAVDSYSAAVAQNGADSSQAAAARKVLITDILDAGSNAAAGQTELANYTAAVKDNGAKSDAARAARAALIKDLEATGLNAQAANGLVDGLTGSLQGLVKGSPYAVKLKETGAGTFVINGNVAPTPSGGVNYNTAVTKAEGGLITGGSGPTADDVLIRASGGEWVVQASSVAKYGGPAMAAVNAGKAMIAYAAGGAVPGYSGGIGGLAGATATDWYDFQSAVTDAMEKSMTTAFRTAAAAAVAGMKGTAAAYNGPGTLSAQAIMGYWTGAGGPGGQTANIAQAITGPESGRRPGAVQQGQPYGCVPLDTRILTRRGWLAHDQVRPGDQTIGYNPDSGRSEWTLITAVHHYDDAEVWRIGNNRWHADVTPDHRWWSDTETETGTRGEFVRTRDLGAHHRIRLAAPADTDGIPGLFLHECAIIGWLMGDGHVGKGQNHGVPADCWEARIYQSKPGQVIKIRALLAGIPHTERTRQRGPVRMLSHEFRLSRAYANDLLKRAHWGEMTPEEFVLALSPDQRIAWLAAMIDAEGNHIKDTVAERGPSRGARPAPGTFTRISQVDGPMQDAITLAVYLDGWNPSRSPVQPETSRQAHQQPAANIGMRRPHVTAGRSHTVTILGKFAVWCVSTKLGSWTADQDKHVFLTGNSTGWGLWQITPGDSEPQAGINSALLNPHNNAIAAVAKYRGSGGFSPWTTFEDGLYIPYLLGGIQAGLSDPAPSGYAKGGLITEPIIGFGQHTGRSYTFGENGKEWVTPAGGPGPAGSGGVLANNLSIMMPEGASLAAAFTELNFRLKVAQQQGWAGLVTSG